MTQSSTTIATVARLETGMFGRDLIAIIVRPKGSTSFIWFVGNPFAPPHLVIDGRPKEGWIFADWSRMDFGRIATTVGTRPCGKDLFFFLFAQQGEDDEQNDHNAQGSNHQDGCLYSTTAHDYIVYKLW